MNLVANCRRRLPVCGRHNGSDAVPAFQRRIRRFCGRFETQNLFI